MYILSIRPRGPSMDETFEFDDDKSRSNRDKHGITFGFASGIWFDRNMVVLQAKTEQEERFLAIGEISDRLWTVVFTMREDRIRIISARRARASERAQYEWQRVR